MRKRSRSNKKELVGSRVELSFRRHVLPPLFGLFTMVVVLGFLNSQVIASRLYLSSHKTTPPSTIGVSKAAQQAQLIISNVGVDAPVIYDQTAVDEQSFQHALQRGVVHYPNTALPGQSGNVVIFGHSSGQVWARGDYKFIFATLDKLRQNDKIYLEYKGVRYIYAVTGLRVVPPTDVSVLNPTTDNILTLITCTPVGTNKNRLIVSAKQIVPKPTQNNQNAKPVPLTELEALPSNHNPSLWESIRSLF